MIYGIGADMVQVERMAKSIQRPHFVKRVFSLEEQALLESRGPRRAAETAAANFAAKEAFLKACGMGLGGLSLAEMAALRRESGAPYFKLSGMAAAFCEENRLQCHLSITHDGGFAAAFVVLEKP